MSNAGITYAGMMNLASRARGQAGKERNEVAGNEHGGPNNVREWCPLPDQVGWRSKRQGVAEERLGCHWTRRKAPRSKAAFASARIGRLPCFATDRPLMY